MERKSVYFQKEWSKERVVGGGEQACSTCVIFSMWDR